MTRVVKIAVLTVLVWSGLACAAIANLMANTGRLCLAVIFAPIVLLMGAPPLVAVAVAGLIGAIVFAGSGPILAPKSGGASLPHPVQTLFTTAFWIAVAIGVGVLAVYERRRLLSIGKRVVKLARKGAPGGPSPRAQ